MLKPKKLYIITGKGGVGKTTAALALCKFLKDNNHNVEYTYFQTTSLNAQDKAFEQNEKLANELGIKTNGLVLAESAEMYIAKKLNSQIIAKGVIRAPFFKALLDMIPGFNYLIYMGQILQEIKDAQDKQEELIVVLDSPSSGHALTMLESTTNFQNIFRSGLIFDDTQKMLALLNQSDFTQIQIITLPNQLALSEATELEEKLGKITPAPVSIFANNSISHISGIAKQDAPDFIKKKIEIELETIKESNIKSVLSHSIKLTPIEIVKDLVPSMENLV